MTQPQPSQFLSKHVNEAIQSLGDGVEYTPVADSVDAIRMELESVLLQSSSVRKYCGYLNKALGGEILASCELTDDDLTVILAEGLRNLRVPTIIQMVIDRGTIVALHELILNEWPEYWSRRAATDGLTESLSGLATAAEHREAAFSNRDSHYLVLKGERSPEPSPSNVSENQHVVPPGQSCWLTGKSTDLTISTWRNESGLAVKISPLFLASAKAATAILVDESFLDLSSGTRLSANWQFDGSSSSAERYFAMEYRSQTVEVVILAALTGEALTESERNRLFSALLKVVSSTDSRHSQKLRLAWLF